jgi:sRNA-binding protein
MKGNLQRRIRRLWLKYKARKAEKKRKKAEAAEAAKKSKFPKKKKTASNSSASTTPQATPKPAAPVKLPESPSKNGDSKPKVENFGDAGLNVIINQ